MLKKNSDKQKGFTFIETIVSLTILAFIFLGVLTMTAVQIQTNSFTQHHTKAVQLAEEAIERNLRMKFSNLTSGTTTETFKNPNFTRTLTLTKIDDDNFEIKASVRWISSGIVSKPIVLSIIRTRR